MRPRLSVPVLRIAPDGESCVEGKGVDDSNEVVIDDGDCVFRNISRSLLETSLKHADETA